MFLKLKVHLRLELVLAFWMKLVFSLVFSLAFWVHVETSRRRLKYELELAFKLCKRWNGCSDFVVGIYEQIKSKLKLRKIKAPRGLKSVSSQQNEQVFWQNVLEYSTKYQKIKKIKKSVCVLITRFLTYLPTKKLRQDIPRELLFQTYKN